MTIEWKDPNKKVHGKRHKNDRYYYRWHYGKQRKVYFPHVYVDNPTESQQASREDFTERRREVARQLNDPTLRARWERRFKADPQSYKMLHTYVYAMLKKGETCTQKKRATKQQTTVIIAQQQPSLLFLPIGEIIVPLMLSVPRKRVDCDVGHLHIHEKSTIFAA